MSRVLVTGGAGFVGSHVVDALLERGVEVLVLDALLEGEAADPPSDLDDRAEVVLGDIRDVELVQGCLRGVDAVCHQASMVGLGVDLGDLTRYVSHNDLGTAALLSAMYWSGFRGRLVLASSMVVYGEGRSRCQDHGVVQPGPRDAAAMRCGSFEPPCPLCGGPLRSELVPEEAPLEPRNVYAATKVHQEHLCAAYSRETGVPVTTLRYHNVYGPRMPRDTPYAGVASMFRSALAAGRRPAVFEDGRQMRDFVHVRDVARANSLALLAEPAVEGPVNIASGEPHSVVEMAFALAAGFGRFAPRPEVTGSFRLGDVRHIVASCERAEAVLGFRAEVSFLDGMREFATTPLREPPSDPGQSKNRPFRSRPIIANGLVVSPCDR